MNAERHQGMLIVDFRMPRKAFVPERGKSGSQTRSAVAVALSIDFCFQHNFTQAQPYHTKLTPSWTNDGPGEIDAVVPCLPRS
jgi:hypothetical protein